MGRPPSCTCGKCAKCQHAAYMRAWYQNKTPEERQAWIARRDIEAVRANDRKRNGTPKRRASLYATTKRMRAKHHDKYLARGRLAYALRTGKIERQPCQDCGNPKSEAHHPDYSKPLEVYWLCRIHHKALHGVLRSDYPQ